MKKTFKIFLFILLAVLFFKVNHVSASNGTFWLRSTNENDYKCWAASARMQAGNYKIIVSCKNILYPVEDNIFSYILWANPTSGGNPIKLGSIGLGTGEYSTKTPFASLFVTTEKNSKTNEPEGSVVMRGSVRPITFLEDESSNADDTDNTEEGSSSESISPTVEPTQASVRDRLILGLKRAGLASGLALVAILGLVFVLTRPK